MADAPSGFNLLLLIIIIVAEQAHRRRLETRLDVVQRQLLAIAAHLNVDVLPKLPPEVKELLQSGRKIEAIKKYRELTSAGLKEAKDAVESVAS